MYLLHQFVSVASCGFVSVAMFNVLALLKLGLVSSRDMKAYIKSLHIVVKGPSVFIVAMRAKEIFKIRITVPIIPDPDLSSTCSGLEPIQNV